MHPAHHTRLILLGVLLALGAFLFAFAGCTRVADTTTGISLDLHRKPEKCIKACKESFEELREAEKERHKEGVEVCGLLSRPQRRECLAAERARHAAAMDAISQGRRDCKNNCHNQGGGGGG